MAGVALTLQASLHGLVRIVLPVAPGVAQEAAVPPAAETMPPALSPNYRHLNATLRRVQALQNADMPFVINVLDDCTLQAVCQKVCMLLRVGPCLLAKAQMADCCVS
jgi:hypothetical protein